MSKRVEEIIQEQIKLNEHLFGDSDHFLFQVKNNIPLHPSAIHNQLKKVDASLHSHMLRHTHISLLAEKGFDLKYIMNRVGHNEPKTTLKIYTHVTDRLRKQQAEKLNDLL